MASRSLRPVFELSPVPGPFIGSTFLALSLAVFDLHSALVVSAKTSTDGQWMEQTATDVFETTKINERIAMKEEYLPMRGSVGLWFQQRSVGLSRSNTRPSHNSKELIMLNLVEEFTAVRIGFRIFTMKTMHSRMLEHRNQKGDLARQTSGRRCSTCFSANRFD